MSITSIISGIFLRIFQRIFTMILAIVYRGKPEYIPPSKSSILMESASTIAQRIRTRKVTSYEVVKTFIDRIEEINDVLNCVVDHRFEAALEDAQKVDDLLASSKKSIEQLEEETPFLGVPFTIKECIAVKGFPHTSGVYARKNIRAEKDAEIVDLLKKAGAIPLAVTNVAESCMWMETNNPVYGLTRNPYNTNNTVGGSSGGEACLQASSGSPLGIGTDLGGSIRLPSAFNGVYGHKPSAGISPINGIYPVSAEHQRPLETVGPLSRYSADLLPFLKVMAKKSKTDLKLNEPVDVSKLKVYYMEDDGGGDFVTPVDPEIKKAIKRVLDHFKKSHKIAPQKVNLEKIKHSVDFWSAKMRSQNGDLIPSLLTNGNGKINVCLEIFKNIFGLSRHTMAGLFPALLERRWPVYGSEKHKKLLEDCDGLKKEFQDLLGSDGIFIYPTHPNLSLYHLESLVRPFDFGYTAIFNVLGLPATHCPLGHSSEGLPVGVQVVGGLNQDRLTIAVARDLEKALGGWTPSPTHGTLILKQKKLLVDGNKR